MAVLCLMATALLGPLLVSPAVAFGEHGFAANPVAGAGDPYYPVYSASTLAQSFQVTTTFLIKSVTLRVQNEGSNVNSLTVSIHPDDPVRHIPAMGTTLASGSQVTPNGASGPVNWTFPFNPAARLVAGSTYWIVAQNSAPQAPPTNGYAWVESNADSYAGGSAWLLDPFTGVWTGLPYDLFFSTYGLEYASNVSASVAVNRTQAQPGDSVTFTVNFNNTGNQTAPNVWINDTLPSELVNPIPAFPDLQPVSAAAFPNLTFRDVANGPHYFTIRSQVAYGTAPGTWVTNAVGLSFENATGAVAQRSPATASLQVGLVTKQLYLGGTSTPPKLLTTTRPILSSPTTSSLNPGAAQPLDFQLAPAIARPFVALSANASLWISIQKPPPQTLKLNVSVLDNASVVSSLYPTFVVTTSGYHLMTFTFPAMNYTFGVGHRIRLQIWSLGGAGGSTDTMWLAYNGTGSPSHMDLRTTTYVSIGQLLLGNAGGPTSAWSPADPLVTWANVSDPFGSSRIAGAWINITSPAGQLVVSSALGVLSADGSALPAWKLFGYTLSPPLITGRYRVDVIAREDNGVASRAEGFAQVAVPSIALQNLANVSRARVGMAFAYFLYFNNTGTGPAGSVWINDTLPSELTYTTSSLAYTSVSGSTYTWALTGVAVGNHVLEVDVTVPATSTDTTVVVNRASLDSTDTSGHPQPRSYSNASVILNGPLIGLSVVSSPATVIHSNQSVTFTIGLQNTGDAAEEIWLNDTLPSTFVYDSDTAATLGGSSSVSGTLVRFHFAGMPAGTTWYFQLLATAGPALTRNASYGDAVTLTYTGQTGLLMPPTTGSVALMAMAPWIPQGAISFDAVWTSPAATVEAAIRFANLGNEPASRVWVNLTLDPRLALVNASAPCTSAATAATCTLGAVPVGPTSIYVNVTVNGSTPDQTVLQLAGTVEYQDGMGNPLPRVVLAPGALPVDVAVLDLNVSPSAPMIEAGSIFPLVVSMYNWGNGSTRDVWLNVTLPPSLMYSNDTSGTALTILGSHLSWHWSNQVPGPFVFNLYVEPRETTPNGTAADLDFHAVYWDAELRPRPALDSQVHAVVVAPALTLSIAPSEASVRPGDTVTYALRVENRGYTMAAQVQITDDVEPSLAVLSYESSVAATGTRNLTWIFADLAPGGVEWINLTARVVDGLPAGTLIPMAYEANYTNSQGTPLNRVRSLPTIVTVETDLTPFFLLGLGGATGGLVIYAYLARRRKAEIEEVFLVYRDGVLISHLSRSLMREKDEDVLSGMLTAVQEFVREAFQYGEHRELHKLDFGEYQILIERGKFVYLAVVYAGEESSAIRKKVRTVIDRIEEQFGTALERWDGDMEEVVGARDLIRDTLLGTAGHPHNHNHAAKPPMQRE